MRFFVDCMARLSRDEPLAMDQLFIALALVTLRGWIGNVNFNESTLGLLMTLLPLGLYTQVFHPPKLR
jgi:hypothetical protein